MSGRIAGIRHKGFLGLAAANVLVFAAVGSGIVMQRLAGSGYDLAPWLGLDSRVADLLFRPWTPLTYMITHTGGLHLLFNMLWLWLFGFRMGDRRLLRLYVGGGLSGAVFYLALSAAGGGSSLLLGASASVLAVTMGAAIYYGRERVRLFLIGEVRLGWVAALCVILSFLGLDGGNAGGGWAHLGGVLFGAAYPFAGRLYRRRRRDISSTRHTVSRRAAKSFGGNVRSGMSDMEAMDALLDKIRVSGYGSLSSRERAELEVLSRRLRK